MTSQDQLIGDPINQAKYPSSLGGNRLPGVRLLGGYRIGSNGAVPSRLRPAQTYSMRDQFTLTVQKGRARTRSGPAANCSSTGCPAGSCNNCNGFFDVTDGPVPANIEAVVPGVGRHHRPGTSTRCCRSSESFSWQVGDIEQGLWRPDFAAWIQDDWAISTRLTAEPRRALRRLAQPVRNERIPCTAGDRPFLVGNRPADKNNVAPRLGFAYSLNDRTVVRGGAGKYYAIASSNVGTQILQAVNIAEVLRPVRRARRLHDQPVERAGADLRAGDRDSGVSGASSTPSACRTTRSRTAIRRSIGVERQLGSDDGGVGGLPGLRSARRGRPRLLQPQHQPDATTRRPARTTRITDKSRRP